MSQTVRPMIPAFQLMLGAEGVEEDEIFQPPGILRTESFEPVKRVARSRTQEIPPSRKQQRHFLRKHGVVVDLDGIGILALKRSWLRRIDPTRLRQPIQTD